MKSKTIGILSAVASVTAIIAISGLSFASAAIGGPTVLLSSTSASTTNSASIPVTATFSGPVTGFSTSSIDVTNATIMSVAGSGSTYTFDIMPTAQGTSTVIIPSDMASSTDASSTGNQASNTLSFWFDTTAPTIAQVTGIASTTSNATPSFTFSSNEAGTIGLSGGCMSSTSIAISGSNMLTFDKLVNGGYTCGLSVKDAAGNTSNILPIDFTVATGATTSPATTTPMISGVTVSTIGTNSATIAWTTDANSTSKVMYGTSAMYGSMSTLNSTPMTSHSVTLTGLSEATLYHFEVVSGDASGTATSSDMVFVTQSTASTTPLAITGIDTTQGNATADGTFADGWQWVLHFVVPDVENVFAMKFGDFFSSTSSSTIPAANDIRIFSSESSNASSSSSAIIETSNDYGANLMLTGDTATTTPGRQIDVIVQVAVPSGTPTGSYTTTFGAKSATSTSQ